MKNTKEYIREYMREYMRRIRLGIPNKNSKIDLKNMSDFEKKEYFKNKTREYRMRKCEKILEEKRKDLII